MKLFVSALALALVQLSAPAARAETEFVTFNYDIARSFAGDGVSFLESEVEPLPGNLLMGLAYTEPSPAATSTSSTIKCSTTTSTTVSGEVTVLIAISKCLSDASIKIIKDWAEKLQADQKTFFQRGTTAAIKFEVASVPGSCQALTEAQAHGQTALLSESEEGDDRLSIFSDFARVLDALPSSTPTETITNKDPTPGTPAKKEVPIAVVSFVDNYTSLQTVQQYELTEKIGTTFNFRICEKGQNCVGSFENCIELSTPVDVFMYSPFKITSTFNCAELEGGIPVTYVDNQNVRQCACTCPTGTQLSSNRKKCETVTENTCKCVWGKGPFKWEVTTAVDKCEFTKIATNWNIPVPVPIDNYVAKDRWNQNDAPGSLVLKNGPHIDLTTVRINDAVYNIDKSVNLPSSFPEKLTTELKGKMTLVSPASEETPVPTAYSWREYQANRKDKVDKFTYKAYGKYKLVLDANDYNATAKCEGCIAIVDKFRPKPKSICPGIICDKSTSDCTSDEGIVELTTANVARVETQIKAYYSYQDGAENDACDASSVPKRCDDDRIKKKNFIESSYSSTGANYRTDGSDFYSTSKIKADFANKVTKVAAADLTSKETPVEYGKCMRCVDLSTDLKEKWTDFSCSRDYDIEKCEGGGYSCSVKQCLVAFGDTIAVASAKINDDTVSASKAVLNELVQQGYNAETQIHVALQCTKFKDNAVASTDVDEKCTYKVKVSDLLDTSVANNANSIFTKNEAEGYVSWRYRIDTASWKEWEKCDEYEFNKAETKITLEAWTKCGIVRKFYFYVNLHLNTPVDVCSNFRSMWYQTANPKLTAPDDLCTYPKSDFAELTFDYHANIGLQYSPDRLTMNVSKVECRLNYDGLAPVKIVDLTKISPEIVTRFAVLAQRSARTSPLTKIHVTCDFTYKRYNNQAALLQTCNQDFFITDCTGPEIDGPCPLNNKDCPADKCIGSPNPAPYEACGGNIVSASGANTVFNTAADKSCCEFCPDNYQTTCKRLSQLPEGENDIKRCEPTPKTGGYSVLAASYMASSDALAKTTSSGRATALLSASAAVAVVALVVVKRRRAAAAAASPAAKSMLEDAYYPLLN